MITIKDEASLEARQGADVETICKAWWGDDIAIWISPDQTYGDIYRKALLIASIAIYHNVGKDAWTTSKATPPANAENTAP